MNFQIFRKIGSKYASWRFRRKYKIGQYTYGLPKVWKWGSESSLSIGKFCSIAPGVEIFMDADHRVDWVSTYPFPAFFSNIANIGNKKYVSSKGNIEIGNDVWIGFGVKILSGVKIGDGAVIGAGAVITKDVPAYSVAVGNPARIVRSRFDSCTVDKLLALKWWDWPIEKILENASDIMGDSDEFISRHC